MDVELMYNVTTVAGRGFVIFLLATLLYIYLNRRKGPWTHSSMVKTLGWTLTALLALSFLTAKFASSMGDREFMARNVESSNALALNSRDSDVVALNPSGNGDDERETEPPDFSGMAFWQESLRLVVSDSKSGLEPGRARLSVLDLRVFNRTLWPVTLAGLFVADELSDLESICPIPGRPNEFLIAESGYYLGKYGRLLRVVLQPFDTLENVSGNIVQYWQWPDATQDIEGLLCFRARERYGVVSAKRHGVLCMGFVDIGEGHSDFAFVSERVIPAGIGDSLRAQYPRLVTELHLSAGGEVWAAAAYEPDEGAAAVGGGPFESLIYHLGWLDLSGEFPIKFVPTVRAPIKLAGFKVEALSIPYKNPEGRFVMGTDDESFGGVWRTVRGD